MMRLHSENEILLCGRCRTNWTGNADGHCTECSAELAPLDWWRLAVTLAAAAIIVLAVAL